MTTAQDGGKLVRLTPRLYPQEMFLVLISVRGRVDPRAIVRSEGFYVNEKFPITPAGIEPATFGCVAQRLNRCATAAAIYIYMCVCVCVCVCIYTVYIYGQFYYYACSFNAN